MGKKVSMEIGTRFGRYVVIGESSRRSKRGSIYYVCKCDCGNVKEVDGISLRNGSVQSCGCYNRDLISKDHPVVNEPLYPVYAGIRRRCYHKTAKEYRNYGGRGISMCDEWRTDFFSFQRWAFDSGYKEGLWIERINNDGDYSPDNCRWATPKEQQRNKRVNIIAEINGESKCLADWADEYGIKWCTIHGRWKKGLRGDALVKPVDISRSHPNEIKTAFAKRFHMEVR